MLSADFMGHPSFFSLFATALDLPEDVGENANDLVMKVRSLIGLAINQGDISSASYSSALRDEAGTAK